MTDITVFSVVRESECSECGTEIFRSGLLRMENGKPLCMACADLDDLVWLPRGNAALTRRAGRYSTLKAVIVRFSRARKRYERQGILVEEDALRRAEEGSTKVTAPVSTMPSVDVRRMSDSARKPSSNAVRSPVFSNSTSARI